MTQTQSRSQTFFNEDGIAGLTHRTFTRALGYDDADMSRPLIGICNTYSELNSCNSHLRVISEAVKRGVLQAGGLPLEFPTISLGEIYLSPTSMLLPIRRSRKTWCAAPGIVWSWAPPRP